MFNWIKKQFSRRSLENPSTPFSSVVGQPNTIAGQAIDEETCFSHLPVYAAINRISTDTSAIQSQLDAKPDSADLADIATSGDYDDLTNKPTIPTPSDFVSVAPASSARNVVQPSSASVVPLVVRGAASQSAAFVEIQDSSGNVILKLSNDGDRPVIQIGDTASDNGLSIRNHTGGEIVRFQDNACIVASNSFVAPVFNTPFSEMAFTSHKAVRDGNNGVFFGNASNPCVTVKSDNATAHSVALQVETPVAAAKGVVVKGASGQTNRLTEWQTSGGTTLAYVSSTGQIVSALSTGTAPFSVNSTTKVTNLNADWLDGYSSTDFVFASSPYANMQQYDGGNTSGTYTYDYAVGRQQIITASGNTTITITNGSNCSAPAVLILDNTGAYTISYSGNFDWAGGSEPMLGAGVHVLIMIYNNKSGRYLCNVSQSYA